MTREPRTLAVVKPRLNSRIRLEKLKRYPALKRHVLGKNVRIWSAQWEMWWRENAQGYTPDKSEAWVTTFEHAWDVSAHAGPEKQIEYVVTEP